MGELPVLDETCSTGSCKDAGHYFVRGQCGNCGAEFRMKLTRGHEKPGSMMGARCPTCDCRRVAGYELLAALEKQP